MNWPHEDNQSSLIIIEEAYDTISEENNALLCPIGKAWKLAEDENPNINLYAADGNHCNIYGTYLNACTFYSLFTGISSQGLSYDASGEIDIFTKNFLQEIGWEIYLRNKEIK